MNSYFLTHRYSFFLLHPADLRCWFCPSLQQGNGPNSHCRSWGWGPTQQPGCPSTAAAPAGGAGCEPAAPVLQTSSTMGSPALNYSKQSESISSCRLCLNGCGKERAAVQNAECRRFSQVHRIRVGWAEDAALVSLTDVICR